MAHKKENHFSLEPFYFNRKVRLMGVDFSVAKGEDIYNPCNPVFETLPNQTLDYGRLFTYAFRRFGLPNKWSDGYKDIAEWILNTPHSDLFLILRPLPFEEMHLSIFFMASEELAFTCLNWERGDIDAWFEHKLDWAERQGLPDWMPEILRHYQETFDPSAKSWRDFYRGYLVTYEPSSHLKSTESQSKKDFTEFAAKVSEYAKIQPMPGLRSRYIEISQWDADDPLKPLALAAIEALADLQTGVRVRDMAINAFGRMEDGEGTVVDEPISAGMSVGLMFNQVPEESVRLQQTAFKLGDGNVKTGVDVILELIENLNPIMQQGDEEAL